METPARRNRPAPKHLILVPDPSVEQAPASLSELLLPADNSTEEPPRREFGWSRVGLPLAGVVAVIAAALSAQYLFNGSSPDTDGAGVQRQAPAAAGQQPTMPTADGARGADQEVPFEGGE